MSSAKSRSTTPPESRKKVTQTSVGGGPVFSLQDIKRLVMGKIVAGMVSSDKYDKFQMEDIITTAKALTDKIIEVT